MLVCFSQLLLSADIAINHVFCCVNLCSGQIKYHRIKNMTVYVIL